MLAPKFSEVIYNGFWYSPEMDFLLAAFAKSQEALDGTVTLKLYKGNAYVVARTSPTSLYNQDLSSMEVGWIDQVDSRGFINISALRLKAHHLSSGGKPSVARPVVRSPAEMKSGIKGISSTD
jgi:argininosuccinate synthase